MENDIGKTKKPTGNCIENGYFFTIKFRWMESYICEWNKGLRFPEGACAQSQFISSWKRNNEINIIQHPTVRAISFLLVISPGWRRNRGGQDSYTPFQSTAAFWLALSFISYLLSLPLRCCCCCCCFLCFHYPHRNFPKQGRADFIQG